MALIVIVDDDGRQHLIHSSQIGPQVRRLERSESEWAAVWDRVDGEPAAEQPDHPRT